MSNWLHLENKVIIVTGGETGIGHSIVKKLHSLSAKVVSADINADSSNKDDGILHVPCDISKTESIDKMIEQVVNTYGKIDVLINNAGVAKPQLLVDVRGENPQFEANADSFDFIFNINVKGVFLCTQAVVKQFIKQGSGGVIVNMSSESSMEGSAGQSIYAASKNAINSFTRSWAKELGSLGIRVVAMAPGILEETSMRSPSYNEALAYTRNTTVDHLTPDYSKSIPLGRPGYLEEISDLAAYLASDRSSYITGTVVNVTGGKSRG
jgi:sorbitol-6-phosphate 2-dehydrogenase